MEVITHTINDVKIAEVSSPEIIINNAEDGLDLMGNLYYQGFERIIIYEKNITQAFFDLKNGLAGEILQKFSNYRIRLIIVGDFNYTSQSIKDFIYESNNGKQVNFLPSVEIALQRLAGVS